MKKIYILHGWAYETSKWKPLIDQLKRKGVTSIVLNIPGLTEPLGRPWVLDDYVNWLHQKIHNEKDVVLLGHSNGGRIALAYVLKHPSKVLKLFLIDSAGIYHNELPIRLKRTVFKFLAKIGKKLTKSIYLTNLLYKFVQENDYNQASETTKKTMQNLIQYDLGDKLENIKNETHILWGEDDKITPLTDGIFINQKIKNSDLKIIKGARHSPQFSHMSEVATIIYDNI